MTLDYKIGWAVVGLGGLTTREIIPALERSEHSRLTAVVTGSPEKAAGFPEVRVYSYDDFDEIAADPAVEVVYIVTPNGLHKEFAIRAAQAGKHVFCEKPLANDAAEAREIIAACETAGVRLATAYRCQLEPHHREAIRFCREETFGRVRHIDASFGFKIAPDNHARLTKNLSKGGALLDVGVYCVQACRYLTGEEPVEVAALESKTDPETFAEVDETIAWTMRFPSGITANCLTTFGFSGANDVRVLAEKGSFGMSSAFSYGEKPRCWTSDPAQPLDFPAVDQFAVQMDAFSRSIMEDLPFAIAADEGLKDHLVMDAIYRSIASGKKERVELA